MHTSQDIKELDSIIAGIVTMAEGIQFNLEKRRVEGALEYLDELNN